MNSAEKEKILSSLLHKLKNGVDEEEVRKEFEAYFPKNDSWSQSSLAGVPNIKETSIVYHTEKDPLVLLAEENGAFRALMKNIRFDLFSDKEDNVTREMLHYGVKRLTAIHLHYEKIQKVIFPELQKRDVSTLNEVKEKEDSIVLELQSLIKEKDLFTENNKERLVQILSDIEYNITYEHHFLFPILDGNLTKEEAMMMYVDELRIGLALVRERSIL